MIVCDDVTTTLKSADLWSSYICGRSHHYTCTHNITKVTMGAFYAPRSVIPPTEPGLNRVKNVITVTTDY